MRANSPGTAAMIRRGMAEAKDSLDYYDFFLKYMRYNIMLSAADTAQLGWDRAYGFLSARKRTPRIKGMLGYLYNMKGAYYYKFHYNPHLTADVYRSAYDVLFGSDMQERLPDVCANLGDAYVEMSDMPMAAYWYRRALYLADSLKLPAKDNVSLYTGLGRIYTSLEDYGSAYGCYEQTERDFSLLPLNMKLYFLNNYGNFYYYKGDYAEALKVFRRYERLLLENKMSQSYDMFLCRLNMADVYLNLGMEKEAYANLDVAEEFFKSKNDATVLYYCHTIRIGLALRHNDVAEVRRILDKEPPDYVNDFNLVNIRHRYMLDYYVKSGDYKKAYERLMENGRHNDSLKHNTMRMRASEIMMRYTQDTLQLHHKIEMQEKDADMRNTKYGLYSVVALLVILALIFLFVTTYNRKRKLQMQMRLMQLQLMNTRNRISPHFIFNVLNNRIVHAGKKDAGELMELAKLIRANLNLSGKCCVSLKEELGFVNYYISVERENLGPEFVFSMNVPDESVQESIAVPSMFVQILVENSIKHALRGLEGEKRLNVDVSVEGETCLFKVTDNGKGFDIRRSAPDSTKTGLKVILSTINLINRTEKRKIRLSIRNVDDGSGGIAGCEATLAIPIGLKPEIDWN